MGNFIARILLICSASAFLGATALAQLGNGQPSNFPGCDSFCGVLVNGDGSPKGLNGGSWSTADDQWCANHGSQTNPNITYQPSPNATAPNQNCSVTMMSGDKSCAQNQLNYNHCGYHNGQVEQQCEAYVAAGQGQDGEKLVLYLDIAATGTCTAACAASTAFVIAHPLTVGACRASGTAASTGELIQTLLQKTSPVSKILSSAMAGYGLYQQGSAIFATTVTTDKGAVMSLDDLAKQSHTQSINADINSPLDNAKRHFSGADVQQSNVEQAQHESCMAALMYAVMTGMRYQAISAAASSKSDACSSVQSMISTANTVALGANASLPGSAGMSGGTSGGSSGSMTAQGTGSSALRCMGSGGSIGSCSGISGADVTAMQNSGLGQQIAPAAAQLASSPAGAALAQGQGNLAGAIGAAGGSSAGDAGNAVTTVAAAAQQHAQALSEGVPGTMLGGGGGGGRGGGSGAAPNPFAALSALFNQGNKDQTPVGGTVRFPGQTQPVDIWHKNTDQNIFQIISGRITKASQRLQ